MSPKVLTRQESQARTRAKLVQAATRVFLLQGYHGASIGQIAKAAGYTAGAVYSNFAGKEELCLAVLEARYMSLAGALQEELAAAEPTLDARLAVIDRWWSTMLGDEQWALLSSEFGLATRNKPEVRQRLARGMRLARMVVAGVLAEQHRQLGVSSRIDSERLAATVLGLGIGLSVQRFVDDEIPPDTFTAALRVLLAEKNLGGANR